MKIYRYLFFLAVFAIVSCTKEEVATPDIEVNTDKATYAVGEEVTFNLSGNADIISFYSGEMGNDYGYLKGRILSSLINVSFQTQILDGAQDDQFFVKVSTDFNGDYTVENVKAATWLDISDRFRLATHDDNRSAVNAGEVDITDLLEEGKPLYFAFHYINRPNAEFGRYNLWRFQAFAMQATTEIGSVTLADQGTADWSIVLEGPWENNRVTKGTSNFTFRGNNTNNQVYQEAWAVSKPVIAALQTDLGPDRAIGIKSLTDPALQTYQHVYSKPGTYQVTFLAANSNIYDRKEIVRKVEVTVLP